MIKPSSLFVRQKCDTCDMNKSSSHFEVIHFYPGMREEWLHKVCSPVALAKVARNDLYASVCNPV